MTTEQTFETIDMMLNMGPQHPATHGVFRMVLKIDGERVVDVTPHIGYLHRGSEKLAEHETYGQVITLFDRLDYVANLNNELIFCRAVERIMALEVPERAQYLRTILAELNRLASHLLFIGTYAIDLGAMTPIMYGFRERERIQNLFESVTGARMMHNFIRIGGVKEDVSPDFVPRVQAVLREVRRGVEEVDRLLTFNEVFLARTRGVGVIDRETALSCGLTGPSLRASGVPYDVRKDDPYEAYPYLAYKSTSGRERGLLGSLLHARHGVLRVDRHDPAVPGSHAGRANDGPDAAHRQAAQGRGVRAWGEPARETSRSSL